jgi:carbonic anhydrase
MDPNGPSFLVIACIDARLTSFLEPALGLPRNRAMVLRTAGNRVTVQGGEVLRSIAAAIHVKGATEIFIAGHTDCAMARFSAAEVIETFRRLGVARSAFGDADLREWFGAFSDVRANVLSSVDFLRRSEVIPRRVKVHGLVLDPADATLVVTVNGDAAVPAETAPPAEAAKPAEPRIEEAAKPEPPSAAAHRLPPLPGRSRPGPIVISEAHGAAAGIKAEAVPAPQTMMEAILALREVLVSERKNAVMKRQLAEFSTLVKKEKNPAQVLAALEAVFKDAETRHPQLPGIYAFLRASLQTHGGGARVGEFVRRIVD